MAVSIVLAVAAQAWHTADVLLAPVLQLVKATPVASFIILALVWVRGASLSVLISFLMVLPVLYLSLIHILYENNICLSDNRKIT